MMSEAQLPDAATNDAAAVSTDKARSESFSSAAGHNNISAQTQHSNGNNTTNYPTENTGEGSSITAATAAAGGTTTTRAAVSSSTNTHPQSQVMSAPMSVLGANSDRNDYYHRHNSSPSNINDDGSSSADNSSSSNNNTLGKVKAWFASGDDTSSSDNDHTAHDYREFSTPSNNKQAQKKYMNNNNNNNNIKNNNDNDGDVELQQQSQYHRNEEQEEEERVIMEKCSFAYGESSPDKYKSSHRIPSIDPHYSNEESDDEHYNNSRNKKNSNATTNLNNGEYNDEENQDYFGTNYYQNNRRISPSAVAHALTSRAKRTWTERRYRRRLRQSQFIPPNTTTGYTAGDDSNGNGHLPTSSSLSLPTQPPASFHYELTSEHRHAFLAAHAALNSKLPNEQYRNRHANLRLDGHRATTSNSVNNNDLQFDIDGVDGANDDEEELRADLTKSSLAIRGGLIRLPTDNVRLVCDARLQPGILSIETRDVGGVHGTGTQGFEMFGNANRYGNIHGNMMMMMNGGGSSSSSSDAGGNENNNTRQQSERMADSWKRHELAYVLTVDEHIYQRVAQEMGDSYRVPWGIYFCCHETEGGGNHVGIEAAVLILLVIFILLIAGMIAWPTS